VGDETERRGMGGAGCLCRNGDQTRGTSGWSDAEERGECVPRVWQDCVICFDIDAVLRTRLPLKTVGSRAQLQLLDRPPAERKRTGHPSTPDEPGINAGERWARWSCAVEAARCSSGGRLAATPMPAVPPRRASSKPARLPSMPSTTISAQGCGGARRDLWSGISGVG
jgi:hypothetical protein